VGGDRQSMEAKGLLGGQWVMEKREMWRAVTRDT
jgi:hypothetical protein